MVSIGALSLKTTPTDCFELLYSEKTPPSVDGEQVGDAKDTVLVVIDKLTRVCPKGAVNRQIRCSITQSRWTEFISNSPPQCPCQHDDVALCLLDIHASSFDFEGNAGGQPLQLHVDTKLSSVSSLTYIQLNAHTATMTLTISHLDTLTVLTSGTIRFNGFGALTFQHSDCHCRMEDITFVENGIEIGTLTEVSPCGIDLTDLTTVTIHHVEENETRPASDALFTTGPNDTPLTLTVETLTENGASAASRVLCLAKQRKITNPLSCDGQALVHAPGDDEEAMCADLGLWERTCAETADGSFTDQRLGVPDVSCPCHREHSNCTVVVHPETASFSLATNVTTLVVQSAGLTVTGASSPFRFRANSSTPKQGDAECVVFADGENVLAVTPDSDEIAFASRASNVIISSASRLEVVGDAVHFRDVFLGTGRSSRG